MSQQLTTYVPEEAITNTIPLHRAGTAEDMAGAALYLASRGGAWVTGVVIPVDGGALLARIASL